MSVQVFFFSGNCGDSSLQCEDIGDILWVLTLNLCGCTYAQIHFSENKLPTPSFLPQLPDIFTHFTIHLELAVATANNIIPEH